MLNTPSRAKIGFCRRIARASASNCLCPRDKLPPSELMISSNPFGILSTCALSYTLSASWITNDHLLVSSPAPTKPLRQSGCPPDRDSPATKVPITSGLYNQNMCFGTDFNVELTLRNNGHRRTVLLQWDIADIYTIHHDFAIPVILLDQPPQHSQECTLPRPTSPADPDLGPRFDLKGHI